ncbi:MAG: nitroreductase family protein [Candidatus Aenigmarchaeota archaeon]|nr:nitroreductase family protein [Candidatus Aenigmarchaeota archaeon]
MKEKELLRLVSGRRTARHFTSHPKVEELVRLIEAAIWAPSSCNRQLWEYVIVTDNNLISRIDRITRQPNPNSYYIACLYDETKELEKGKNDNKCGLQSLAMANQNMLLMAEAMGLGAKIMGGLNNLQAIKTVLGAPRHLTLACIIAVGRTDSRDRPPERRDIRKFLHFNKISGYESHPLSTNPRDWTTGQLIDFRATIFRYGSRTVFKRPPEIDRAITDNLAAEIGRLGGKSLLVYPYLTHNAVKLRENAGPAFHIITYSKELTKEFREKLGNGVRVREGDGSRISFPPGYFDNVLFIDEITHIPYKGGMLKEICRVTKPEGRIFIMFANKYSLFGFLRNLGGGKINSSYLWRIGPEKRASLGHIKKLLRGSGLEIESCKRVNFPHASTNRRHINRIIWLHHRAARIFHFMCEAYLVKARK